MRILRYAIGLLCASALVLGADIVNSQDYPSKPVRIVTSGVGGDADFAARLIAQGISTPLGQQVIVDNRPSGVIPGDTVAKAPPDGYTLLSAGRSMWIGPLMQKTPYDSIRDFAPVTLAVRAPNVLVVHPSLPVKSVQEFIALAKARPDELNYASAGTGSSSQLAAELFKYMAGVKIQGVRYSSNSVRMTELIGGQVQLMIDAAGTVMPYVKSGKLKGLAVCSAEPSALAPGLPTVASRGVPGYESAGVTAIFAPAKTPVTIVNRLNQEIVRVLNQPDVKEKFFNVGVDVVGTTPEQLAVAVKSDMTVTAKLLKDSGIHAEQ